MPNRAPDLIAELRVEIQNAPAGELPSIRGQLYELETEMLQRIVSPSQLSSLPATGDTVDVDEEIDVKEAARRIGMSVSYLYRHAGEYGGAKHGSALRFSAKQLETKRKRRHYK